MVTVLFSSIPGSQVCRRPLELELSPQSRARGHLPITASASQPTPRPRSVDVGCLRVEVAAAEWGAPRSDTWNLGRWRRHMEREARGVPPSRPAAAALPNPLQMPVGLGVPGDRLAAGGPSQVLVPRPPAPGPDSAPMSPPCPQTPLWAQPTCVIRQLRATLGQRPWLHGGEIKAPVS